MTLKNFVQIEPIHLVDLKDKKQLENRDDERNFSSFFFLLINVLEIVENRNDGYF